MRELGGTSGCRFRANGGVNTTRGFYLNVVPNYTLMNVVFHPPCFLRKFSPDGRHLIAFSTCQRFLEVYRFKGCSAASDLVHEATTCTSSDVPPPTQHNNTDSQQSASASTSGGVGSRPTTPTQPSTSQQQSRSSPRRYCLTEDFLGEDTSHPRSSAQLQLRNAVFGKFFDYLGSVTLVRSSTGQQLNRECSLFTECGRYVIVGSACYLSDDPHPPMHVIYSNNESVSPNPRNPLEDYTIYVVDVHSQTLVHKLTFNTDKIFLSHNQGLYLYKDLLAILSVQHQTALPRSSAFGPRPYHNFREGVINQLKHRILVFLYKRASTHSRNDRHPYELRKFYQYFDQVRCLRMWKMQLLDREHLLIKYASEEVVTLRSGEPNSQFSMFVIYNVETTEVVNVYENTSNELLQHFENFCDFFRNTNYRPSTNGGNTDGGVSNEQYLDYDGGQHQLTSSSSNNVYAYAIQQRFKQTVVSAKNGGVVEARKRVLAQLPISAQSYTGSPYLDHGLFSYDEKWVSVMERPKACGESAINFYGRECSQLKFRIFAGIQGRQPPPQARRLVAFIFHPTEPFAISVQRTNLEYVVNFHIRKTNTCLEEGCNLRQGGKRRYAK